MTTTAIRVVPYDPEWPKLFLKLRDRVIEAACEFIERVEHVGSTSVPGLAAKPVIDMDVIVKPYNLSRVIESLATIGYRHRGNLGIPEREAFFPPDDLPRHNLYVCLNGCTALRNHLAVRDFLRMNPDVANEYGALKQKLAKQFPDDIDLYCEAKTAFILQILKKTGFDEPTLAHIEEANRA